MSALLLKLTKSGPNGPVLRGMIDSNGNQAFSLFDLGNVSCQKDRDSTYGKNIFYRLTKEGSDTKNEIDSFLVYLKFPGSGQRQTPCAGIRGLQRYLMMLGGKVAAEFREIVESTFTRVMAGDQSLIEVVHANAASTAPVQQAFRAALAQEPAAPVLDEMCGVKRREREEMELDMDLVERKLRLEEMKLRLEEKRRANLMQHTEQALTLINTIKGHASMDERTKLQFEDHVKNLILPPGKLLTNGEAPPVSETAALNVSIKNLILPPGKLLPRYASEAPPVSETGTLNVSIVAKELGFSKCSDSDLIKLGRAMAARYRAAYQCDPPKHKQYVRGNYVPVNSYMERDRPMMERVIRAHFGAETESE